MLVLIKGAGDLASGTALRLHNAGFDVMMTDIAQPTAVRRAVSFCECIYEGTVRIENVEGRHVQNVVEALRVLKDGGIPVFIDPTAQIAREIDFDMEIDAIMAKRNTGTRISDAPIVLALGPGFVAGIDCNGVIETKRGHRLGRLITNGTAALNTGIPGDIGGYTSQRLLRAPAEGIFCSDTKIGDIVMEDDIVGHVEDTPVHAQISGVLRGILHDGVRVKEGMKIGDVDPRCEVEDCFSVSDKALAVAGGVLEGLLTFAKREPKLHDKGFWSW